MKRLANERPLYNHYFEASPSSIAKMLMGAEKCDRLYPGEWVSYNIDEESYLVVALSRRDSAASPSGTTAIHTTRYGMAIKGFVETGFYKVTETTDESPDGVQYYAFCTGRKIYRVDIDFEPAHRLRLDRRVRSKPVTTGDLEKLIERAAHDEGLKKALTDLLHEDKEEDKKERWQS